MNARKTREDPSLAAAKRAICRALPHLTASEMFAVAALVKTLQYGEDCGYWELSALYARDLPEDHWKLPAAMKGGGAR